MKCKYCKKLIQRKDFNKNHKNYFCSLKCSHKFQENRIKTKCRECKNIIYVKKSKFERQKNCFCNINCRNKWLKKNISKFLPRNIKHHNWKGNKVKYQALHKWLRTNYNEPLNCEECNKKLKLELANLSGEYKRDIKDYKWLCRGCHQKLDRTKFKITEEKIKSIKKIKGNKTFYDIETETENFIANNLITHNSKPSRRSRATGIYMPSILKENIEIVVAVDTSGSIRQEELSEFLGEIVNISKGFSNVTMKVIVCDCEIKDVYDVKNGSIETILGLSIRGGGGTSHKPVYDYVKTNLPNTKFIINFSDGYTSFPSYEEVKTIWVLTKNSCNDENIPFGDIIRLN